MQKVYDLYSFNIIPPMGKLVTGDRDSYQYLVGIHPQIPRSRHIRGHDRGGRVLNR